MRRFLYSCLLPFALVVSPAAFAQAQTDGVTPTIPETQLEPAELSSPYEFLSVATSASDFAVEAAALAKANAGSADVKSIAEHLAQTHEAITPQIIAAGATQGVEIATPSMDGEQVGLIGKLTALNGADLDIAYVDSQIFLHQRTIAYYRGYADEENALGAFAQEALPKLVSDYGVLVAMAEELRAAEPATQQ
jgi:predicted outer membrane protein